MALNEVMITKRVRLVFDSDFPIEGTVVGIERGDDDRVEALLIRTPQVESGTAYFVSEELARAELFALE
jgi:hypothetical protein